MSTVETLPPSRAVTPFAAEPLPIGRLLGAYLAEAKYETLNALRTPALAIPFIVIPLAIYLLFGVFIIGDSAADSEWGPGIANYLFSGFAAVGAMMPGIFSGTLLAQERDAALLRLKRALPMPPGAYLIAKTAMSMGLAAIAVALVVIAALAAGKVTISPAQVLVIAAVLVVGTVPFTAIGLFIGVVTTGRTAPAFANLLFLPMMWLSGLFIPLPDVLQRWVVVWPAFHLNQLALNVAGVQQFSFVPAELAGGVLVGITVLFGGLAIRQLARVG